jgi:hypothetical protein
MAEKHPKREHRWVLLADPILWGVCLPVFIFGPEIARKYLVISLLLVAAIPLLALLWVVRRGESSS